ncbi:hypothetical protein HY642_07415 [Candidatus Woesearchaeota archaeon]|nr:hypothetical protein [Candidatus Woesearchaeota archaeon]
MADQLYDDIMAITRQHYPSNGLMPIPGAGAMNPELMLLFINPTARNNSTNPSWKGPRYPFIGCKRPWDQFNKLGWMSNDTLSVIRANAGQWQPKLARAVLAELRHSSIYVTNLVKNTGEDAALPKAKDIRLYLPLLLREIQRVKPERIIALGSMVSSALLGKPVSMEEHHAHLLRHKTLKQHSLVVGKREYPVVPCYYPIGRGNPKKAMEMLQVASKMRTITP